jgi:hypothetical protein
MDILSHQKAYTIVFARFRHGVRPVTLWGSPDSCHQGLPYLGDYRANFAKQRSFHVESKRKGEAMIEFRGFSPKSRDALKYALADQVTMWGADWRYASLIAPNGSLNPFGDSQLCQALSFAVGGWRGSKFLAGHDGVKIVDGVVPPVHSFAATKIVLHISEQLAGLRFAEWNLSGNCAL